MTGLATLAAVSERATVRDFTAAARRIAEEIIPGLEVPDAGR
jgi:hypothetical protein